MLIRCALRQHATTDLASLGQLWAWQGKYMHNIHPVQLQKYIITKYKIKLPIETVWIDCPFFRVPAIENPLRSRN